MMNRLLPFLLLAWALALPAYAQEPDSASRPCWEPAPYHLRLRSQEVAPGTGTLLVRLVLTANRAFQFHDSVALRVATAGISATLQESPSRVAYAPGDSSVFTIAMHYASTALPFEPVLLQARFYRKAPAPATPPVVPADGYVYFTPYNTVEIWDIAAFQRLRRAWFFTPDTSAHRRFVHRDSIPVSNIPVNYKAGENEEFRLVSVPGLAYAIPMLWPDSAQYYADSTAHTTSATAAPEADDCGLGRKRFKGLIDHVKLFTMHRQDGSSPAVFVPIGMKGIEVEIRFRHSNWTEHLMTVYTDDDGYLTRNGNRVFSFEKCANSSRSSIPIFLKVQFRDQSNRVIVWEDDGRDLIVYRTGNYNLPYTSNPHRLVWNGNNQIELPDYLGGKAASSATTW